MDGVAKDLLEFYGHRYVEDDRLRRTPHGRLELVRMRELLNRYVPEDARVVMDLGGGTGIHAQWLAERGHDVELVDLVPGHVEQAGRLPGVRARVGDARELSFETASADAVLVLGPLYHLLDHAERLRALREARRVARPGAPVLVAAVSRHAPALDFGATGELDDTREPLVREAIETGRHDKRLGFTAAHFHTAAELRDEVAEAGFAGVEILGIEGPTWPALDASGMDRVDALLPAAVRCARLVERGAALLAASAHLLAVARR